MLTFYFAPGSSSMAVHIALHETGAPFEARPLSLAAKDTRTPEYLAVNPVGKVPTLVIDGRPLTEVAGCLFYLARTYPEADLLPVNDPEREAQVVSWMSYLASTVHPAVLRDGKDAGREIYKVADARLGRRDWLVGSYSIADMHLFRLFWRFGPMLEAERGSFPNLEAHRDRMMARPAVRKTIELEDKVRASQTR
ncbi:glutathione S-transferase family protein [soil metagenome]